MFSLQGFTSTSSDQITTIMGCTYVLEGGLGADSYHFSKYIEQQKDSEENVTSERSGSYISYESNYLNTKLKEGNYLPKIKYFENQKFDENSRIFTAVINWGDNLYNNTTSKMEFCMEFSQDCLRIESGQIDHFDFHKKFVKSEKYENMNYKLASKNKALSINTAMQISSEK